MTRLTRRRISQGLATAAGLAAAGCATPAAPPARVVVNLAQALQLPDNPLEPAVVHTAVAPDLRMTAPVLLDGHGPFGFVVDTGANRSVMATELRESLGYPLGQPAPVHGIAGVESADTVRVRRLSVGTVTVGDLTLSLLPRDALGVDGLLGVDVLKNRLVTLDFALRRLTVGPSRLVSFGNDASRIAPREADDASVVTVPARYRFGQLMVVDAEAAGLPVTAFLDSGSEVTVANLALRRLTEQRRPQLLAQAVRVDILSATGQTAKGELAELPSLRLGGLHMNSLRAVFSDLHAFQIWDLIDRPAVLIGMDVLSHFKAVDLDFGRRQVRFHLTQAQTPHDG